jgi:hypothetical protein
MSKNANLLKAGWQADLHPQDFKVEPAVVQSLQGGGFLASRPGKG